jgi:selT/selW/selH-like putative selenoprotein
MNSHDAQSKIHNNTTQPNKRTLNEKVIQIETCRECRLHASSTWHDESKYKRNFVEVKEAVELMIPGCKVVEKIDQWINLGAFEVYHGDQIIFSKKKSGLWPNPKAVAIRVKQYFDDYEGGKDISHYGAGPEQAYVPPKKKTELSKTGTGFHQTAQSSQRDMGKSGGNFGVKSDDHHGESNDKNEHDSPKKENKSPEKKKASQEKDHEADGHNDNNDHKEEPVHAKPDTEHHDAVKLDKEHHEKPHDVKVEDNTKVHHEDDASHKKSNPDENAHKNSGHENETKLE